MIYGECNSQHMQKDRIVIHSNIVEDSGRCGCRRMEQRLLSRDKRDKKQNSGSSLGRGNSCKQMVSIQGVTKGK